MCAIQMISAQVGRVTGKGLAGNMRRHYPALLVYPLIALLLVANVINIGADLGAMAAALRLLVDGPQLIFVAAFAIVTVLLEVFMRYSRYASVLRWLTISLFAYVATVFAVAVPWLTVAHNLVVPHIQLSGDYLAIVVAVFGTTISPYLFFWQAAEEVEDEKEDPKAEPLLEAPLQAPRQLARIQVDTLVGMGLSNVIALFIMITTAATLNAHGVTDIQTSSQGTHCALSQDVSPLRFLHWVSSARACLHCRSRGQRRIRIRRNAEWRLAQAGTRSGLLRYNSGGHPCWSRPQFHPARSGEGADLERHNQRGRSGANYGDDYAHGLA